MGGGWRVTGTTTSFVLVYRFSHASRQRRDRMLLCLVAPHMVVLMNTLQYSYCN